MRRGTFHLDTTHTTPGFKPARLTAGLSGKDGSCFIAMLRGYPIEPETIGFNVNKEQLREIVSKLHEIYTNMDD